MKFVITKRDPIQAARKLCIQKFLHYFRKGFQDEKYIAWERQYKFDAHKRFQETFNKKKFQELLVTNSFETIAQEAIKIESRTNLLFSFEKMAIRDAVRSKKGAQLFSLGLYNFLYSPGPVKKRFEKYIETISQLPRKQTRVLTWPLVTVFGFLAKPDEHIFLKPMVTKRAAEKYRFDFYYSPRPNWETYNSLLAFAEQIRNDTKKLSPADNIDLQSFIWVMGSDEYPD